jgi:TPR repeat protein
MYAIGQGVPQDYVLAHMWWNIAGSKGSKDATKNRNIVKNKMTPQQIEKAQEMARNWKAKK